MNLLKFFLLAQILVVLSILGTMVICLKGKGCVCLNVSLGIFY